MEAQDDGGSFLFPRTVANHRRAPQALSAPDTKFKTSLCAWEEKRANLHLIYGAGRMSKWILCPHKCAWGGERREAGAVGLQSGLWVHEGMPSPAAEPQCTHGSQGRCSCPLEKGDQPQRAGVKLTTTLRNPGEPSVRSTTSSRGHRKWARVWPGVRGAEGQSSKTEKRGKQCGEQTSFMLTPELRGGEEMRWEWVLK